MPAVEVDVRTRLVVGLEDLAEDQHEVVQPSFHAGGLKHVRPFPFTQPVVDDVRVSDARVGVGRIGVEGHHFVVGLLGAKRLPMDRDHEWAEADLFQLNGIGRD